MNAPLGSIDVGDALTAIRVERLLRETNTQLEPPRTLTKAEWPPNYDEVLVWRRAQLAAFELNPQLLESAKAFYADGVEGCIAFINHWCDTHDPRNVGTDKPVWMPFILFQKQDEFVRFLFDCLESNQPGLVEKCRTMGATWVCVAVSVWLWLFYPGVAVGWGSQDAVSVDRIGDPKSIFFKLRGLIGRMPECFKPPGLLSEHLKQFVCRNPDNGASIVGEVGDKIGRGGRTRLAFKDESAHYEHPELIEASLSENTRVPIDISSVNGPGNLFHRKRESGMDWFPGAEIEPGVTRVFVMDWRDHPEYDDDWYAQKKKYHEQQGTLHILAQEIDRNYYAAVQGVIIPNDWVKAALDAHLAIPGMDSGGWSAALDVGDSEDGDRNALARRKGVVLRNLDEWIARDPGVTARRAISLCAEHPDIDLQYDSIGIGASVKSEGNRLQDEGILPKNVRLVSWNAGAAVLRPQERVIPEDTNSPVNEDFYHNLKAQAWWNLRTRFYKTWRCIVPDPDTGKTETYPPDQLISIDSKLPLLRKLEKELSQPTASKSARMKLVIDKSPPGTRSPNLGDAVVMSYFPLARRVPIVGLGPTIFVGGERMKPEDMHKETV